MSRHSVGLVARCRVVSKDVGSGRSTDKGVFMNILVIGGAGYIGSITARMRFENDCNVVVFDNLSRE